MMKKIRIANRLIGEGKPVFIIAEAGVNHNGSPRLAKRLIDAAKASGADAVKFQIYRAKEVVTMGAPKALYQKKQSVSGEETQYTMLKRLELSFKDFRMLHAYCRRRNIMFLAAPFDYKSVDLLANLKVPSFKIGSGEITNLPFLKYIAKKHKPVILSTGMSTEREIEEAVHIMCRAGNGKLILLHCVSNYPAKFSDLNLRVIQTLRNRFKIPVGFSDHSRGSEAAIAAVAMGACVIEKHFTLNRNLKGPDHRASLEPKELKLMVSLIRHVEAAMGDGIKRPVQNELPIRKVARRSLVAVRKIPKGTILTKDMIDIKRPGTGVPPAMLNSVVGKKAAHLLEADTVITRKIIG